MRSRLLFVAGALLAAIAVIAPQGQTVQAAGIEFDGSVGTGPPPATLGGYPMTPFPADPRPNFQMVSTVPGPAAPLIFSKAIQKVQVGAGWTNFGHGYLGGLYLTETGPSGDFLTMFLPPGTTAFYFYAQSNRLGFFSFIATASDGTTSGPILVESNASTGGARFFGFYTTGTPTLTSISVHMTDEPDDLGFAVGDFGISTSRRATAGAAAAGVAFAVSRAADANRDRVAAAQQPAPVTAPRTGTGTTIVPPNTGDGGLAGMRHSNATLAGGGLALAFVVYLFTLPRVSRRL